MNPYSEGITLCFIDYPLENNYFSRQLNESIRVVSFYEVSNIFRDANADLRNFVLFSIYRAVTLSLLGKKNQTEVDDFCHDETRGCLFDMCGLKEDIIISATNTTICTEECEGKLRNTVLPAGYIGLLKKELKQIKRSLYYKATDRIKKNPILSLIIVTFSTLLINIAGAAIYDLLRNLMK